MAFSKLFAVLALAAVTIGCDQATKRAARTHLSGRPALTYLNDTVRLQYAENPGAFLGFGASWPRAVRRGVFTIATGAVLLVLAGVSLARHHPARQRAGLCLLWAGGASNLIDRVAHDRVVDFMNVGFGWLRTGIFNVADMAVMAGLFLLLLPWAPSRHAGQGGRSETDSRHPGAASGELVGSPARTGQEG